MEAAAGSYCFDTSPFFDATFDVSSWVLHLLGPDPKDSFLDALQRDLVRFEGALKAEVVAVVNRDYAGFVQLSSKIEGFEGAINRLKPPLLTAQRRLLAVREGVAAAVDRLRDVLVRRDAARSARLLLQDLLHCSELLGKVEGVFGSNSSSSSSARPGDPAELPSAPGAPPGSATVATSSSSSSSTTSGASASASGTAPAPTSSSASLASGVADVETACARLLRVAHWFAALDGLNAKHGHLPFFILVTPRIQVRGRLCRCPNQTFVPPPPTHTHTLACPSRSPLSRPRLVVWVRCRAVWF
jgi:hypothetical protein